MNEQKAPGGIEWTRIKNKDGSYRRGYTWNPVQGCKHDCKWTMPDGVVVPCYAKTVAEKFKSDRFFPQGFEQHYFHEGKLWEPLKLREPAGIFCDSMSDLMGHWVPKEQINQVLLTCEKASHHIFQLLTKNAPRLLEFEFPPNVWAGVSAPPSFMHGKALSHEQQEAMVMRQLHILNAKDGLIRWMSIEPLSFDIEEVFMDWLTSHGKLPLEWVVIGAASNGPKLYPPDREHFENLLLLMDTWKIPVFFKGNMECLMGTTADWRDSFPSVTTGPC